MTMSGQDIVEHFDTTFHHEYRLRRRFLARLEELCHLDSTNARHVKQLMRRIESTVATLPAPKGRSADGTISQLVLMLPDEQQLLFAADSILHPRRSRRNSGYKIIKRHSNHGLKAGLAESYGTYGDSEALVTLILAGEDISGLVDELETALHGLGQRYYQARAIEQILARDEQLAFSLADQFPMAFVWAAGRKRNRLATPVIIEQLERRLQGVECASSLDAAFFEALNEIPLLFWALERVDAKDHIAALTAKYRIALPWL